MAAYTMAGTLGEFIERNGRDHANRAALIYEGRTFTHADMGRAIPPIESF